MKQIKKRGFTLVELVIVIAVIAILAAVLIPTFITVIDNANNSADVQLARNLNTALAEAQVDPDIASSAQNIRYKVKDFGYDADKLATKKAGNVIAYNKKTQRAEVLDVSKVTADQLVPAYYAEEVIDGYIIISTAGNDLAEALYELSNLPSETELATLAATSSSDSIVPLGEVVPLAGDDYPEQLGSYVKNALNTIGDSAIRKKVSSIVESTLYVIGDGSMFFITVNGDSVKAERITKNDIPRYETVSEVLDKMPEEGEETRIRTRVVFSGSVTEFDVNNLAVEKSALHVIVPESVTLTGTIDSSATEIPTFSGNVGNAVPAKFVNSIENTKSVIESDDLAKIILYNANQVYTSDFGGSFTQALDMAKKLHEIADEYKKDTTDAEGNSVKVDYSTIRLIVNGNVTISGDVTIPDYVDVQIPFAIGNSFAKEIMTYDKGNMLGGKQLGDAYPANDAENLGKEKKDQLYYLCGEGPGNGYDVMLSGYLVTLGEDKLPSGFQDASAALVDAKNLFAATKNISTDNAKYSLTVASGATLNIAGNLTVGAVIGYPNAGGYQGHTSGAHGQINNNGTINVQKGGVLDVFGFVKGSGNVNANEGSMVFEPFMVTDYLDTVLTLSLYPFCAFPIMAILPTAAAGTHIPTQEDNFNSPFMRYAVQNIQNTLTLNYGSSLYGRANLIVFGGMVYCRADAPLITSSNYVYDPSKGMCMSTNDFSKENGWYEDADCTDSPTQGLPANGTCFKKTETQRYMATTNGALQMTAQGSSIVCKYNGDKNIQIEQSNCEQYEYNELSNRNSFAGDIGVVELTLNGQVTTSGIKMDLLGGTVMLGDRACNFSACAIPVDTGWCDLPVPYNFHFTVNGDLTIDEGNNFVFMPGSALTVSNSATITIKKTAGLYALGTYDDSEFLKSFGSMIVEISQANGADYQFKQGVDGNYYSAMMDSFDIGSGGDGTMLLLACVLGSMGSFAPKYYPSAELLTKNQFSSSAQFIVEGKITVEEGGDLGGTITAKDSSTITLNSGAVMGKVLNLGGLYDSKNDFLNILKGTSQNQLISGLTGSLKLPMTNLPLDCLGTVYIPCFLEIVNSEGKAVDLTANRQEGTETSTFALTEGTFTSNLSEGVVSAASADGNVTITTTCYTATSEITIGSSELAGASATPAAPKVAYFTYDHASKALTLKDNSSAA